MDSISSYLEAHRDDMISTLQNLIRIPSYTSAPLEHAPFGKACAQALDYMLEKSRTLGFDTHNLDHYIGCADYGEGETCFGILTHLDVVPEGNGWDADPYAASILGNRIVGRGASDDKGPAVAALYALAAVKASSFALRRKVRLIFGCDEESGWKDIEYYKKHQPLPDLAISPDGDYPVVNVEKGILHIGLEAQYENENKHRQIISIEGGTRANVVPGEALGRISGIPLAIVTREAELVAAHNGAKIECDTESENDYIALRVTGTSTHASTPEKGNNAICILLELLARLPVDQSKAFSKLTQLSDCFAVGDAAGTAAGLDCSDEISGALTCSLGLLSFGPNGYSATLDIRYPISKQAQDFVQILEEQGFEASIVSHTPPHHVDESSELVQTLLSVYEEQTGRDGYCLSTGGGTYARAIDNAVTFGCAFPGTEPLMHQPNESIDLDELMLNAKIIANAIIKICT